MKKTFAMLLFASVLAVSGMSAHAEGERFVWISHGPDSDSWFNVIKNAIRVTDQQMGTKTRYRNPPTGDLADMARIVQQSSAAGVDGIIVTIADYAVLEGPIRDAIAKGIPVVTVNSGTLEESRKLGALTHVGQPEYEAGLGAGRRAKADGITRFLCVNHYISNPASVERCRGFADGLGVELGNQMIDSGIDPAEITNKVKAYLTANADTNAILAMGPNSAEPTIRAVKELGRDGDIYFATFDLSADISSAIKDGTIRFAIDQQPFLQGALPIWVLANYLRYGVAPSNPVLSGPAFITRDNIDLLEKWAGQYR